MMTENPSGDIVSDAGARRNQLEDLVAQATSKYSLKDYNAAAELYSQATELQASIYGEMFVGNADLLYAYGRCLYHVAIRKSDVLGTKVAGESQSEGSAKPRGNGLHSQAFEATNKDTRIIQDTVNKDVDSKSSAIDLEGTVNRDSTQYFQFTGDESFEASSNDEEEAPQDRDDADNANEEDDFANAFEVLDLARILLKSKLDEEKAREEGKDFSSSDFEKSVKQVKERLADTHDLQAEISLEGERFPDAVVDLRAALDLKSELYPEESSVLAEAHFKLSLALEFSSITQQKGEDASTLAHVDEAIREEAAAEMDAAIASCKLRIKMEESRLRAGEDTDKSNNGGLQESDVSQQDIDDVKDMVTDMEQRLLELRQPPISLNDSSRLEAVNDINPLGGILSSILGQSPATQHARLEEASRSAKDLTNLVKKKKNRNDPDVTPTETSLLKTNSKRKVEFDEEVTEVETGKKARLSDGEDNDNASVSYNS